MITTRKRTVLRILAVILLLSAGMIWLDRRSPFQEDNLIAILPLTATCISSIHNSIFTAVSAAWFVVPAVWPAPRT